jgi:hypothetical protein
MTILDRARGSRRIRIDPGQFADDLAKRLPDLEQVDLGKARDAAANAISDAADLIRQSIEDAGEKAGELRSDAGKAGEKAAGKAADDLGGRVRSLASLVERELPDTDKDRYMRAFERGRIQTRTRYVVVGAAAGILAGIVGVVFADKQRRDAAARKASELSRVVQGKVKYAQDRARGMAIERGLVEPEPDRDAVGVMDLEAIATPAWPAAAGASDQPLDDPASGPHEALPDDLVGTARDRADSTSV